jgi:cytidylate kinase
MGIITLSRGSYASGRRVAELLAQELGYECVSREELIKESEKFDTFEIKLRRAMHSTTSSVFGHFTYDKLEYLAYIRREILRRLVRDNTVYHGLAGHSFVQGVSHLLSVRIQADFEDRVREEMQTEGLPEEEARQSVKKGDEERRLWSIYVTGIDHWDPSYYDVILNASKIPVREIVDTLARMAAQPYLQTTEESSRRIRDLHLAAEMKYALVQELPEAIVSVTDRVARIRVRAPNYHESRIRSLIREKAEKVQGVEDVRIITTQEEEQGIK